MEPISEVGQQSYLSTCRMLGATIDTLHQDDHIGFFQRILSWVEVELGDKVSRAFSLFTDHGATVVFLADFR